MLYTGCILEQPFLIKGFRISVMSRHTMNDGKTPDVRISNGLYDAHLPQIGPSPKLIGAYHRGEFLWEEFTGRYLMEIRNTDRAGIIQVVSHLATLTNVILMCIECSPVFCHRRLLASECLFYEPELQIEHL